MLVTHLSKIELIFLDDGNFFIFRFDKLSYSLSFLKWLVPTF
jgi:hypothetical protein